MNQELRKNGPKTGGRILSSDRLFIFSLTNGNSTNGKSTDGKPAFFKVGRF